MLAGGYNLGGEQSGHIIAVQVDVYAVGRAVNKKNVCAQSCKKLFRSRACRTVCAVDSTELTCETAMQIGRAAAMVLTAKSHRKPKIYVGKDTRISSDVLEAALIAGICSMGADAVVMGVVPTPAVAFLVKKRGVDSHSQPRQIDVTGFHDASDVVPLGIFVVCYLAYVRSAAHRRGYFFGIIQNKTFYLLLHIVGKLVARTGKKLDSVKFHAVVRGDQLELRFNAHGNDI